MRQHACKKIVPATELLVLVPGHMAYVLVLGTCLASVLLLFRVVRDQDEQLLRLAHGLRVHGSPPGCQVLRPFVTI